MNPLVPQVAPVAPPPINPATIQQGAYDQLKQAVLGAGLNTPTISGLYAVPQSAIASKGANAAGNYNTGVQADYQARQEAEARAVAQKAAQDANDPSKYQQIPKKDGGYTFLDPSGKEISAWAFARITGKSPDQILSKSENPIDQGFINDYKNLQGFLTAVRNNDTKTIDSAYKANPGLKNFQKDIPSLIQQFQKHYPTVFGLQGSGHQSVASSYIPAKSSKKSGISSGGSGKVGG